MSLSMSVSLLPAPGPGINPHLGLSVGIIAGELLRVVRAFVESVVAHQQLLWAFGIGLCTGVTVGLGRTLQALSRHKETLYEQAVLLGHFEAALEVADEEGRVEEVNNRGVRYAQENVIDMETAEATSSSSIVETVRDRPARLCG